MQIYDFHTHVYPPEIAKHTIDHIRKVSGMLAQTDATVDGLLKAMKESGTAHSVILPVVTAPKQFLHVNEYAAKMCQIDGITSLGGIHPDNEDPIGCVHKLRDLGLKGFKIHPDYQNCEFDDKKYLTIFKEAAKEGMIVVTHAGTDPYNLDHVHCTPDMIMHVKWEVPDLKLVCAHVGSRDFHDEVEEKIVGEDIYIDISRLRETNLAQVERIIKTHRPDRTVYASDSPWIDMVENLKLYNSMDLDDELNERVLYKNAQELLESVKY